MISGKVFDTLEILNPHSTAICLGIFVRQSFQFCIFRFRHAKRKQQHTDFLERFRREKAGFMIGFNID